MRSESSPATSFVPPPREGWWFAALTVAIVITGLLEVLPTVSIAQETPTRASFDWSMEPRFGLDADGDGLVEIENSPEYTHNRVPDSCPRQCPAIRLPVRLVATPTPADIGLPEAGFVTYEWRISGPAGSGTYHRPRPDLKLLLPEGEHDVDLRVRVRLPWGSITLHSRGSMVVDDILVVAIGDSYPSGEGSPDIPMVDGVTSWADAADPAAVESHALAHRSSVGWPAQVALALEDGEHRTSVTFVDLAASGARIDSGLLRPRSDPAIPAQLDDVERIVGDRRIDILLIQVGGNDVGFSRIIRALVEADPLFNPFCYEVLIDNLWSSAEDGVWDRGVSVTYDAPFDIGCRSVGGTRSVLPGLEGLDRAFGRLADRLESFTIDRVVLVEYPNPTGGSPDGGQCDEIVGDVTPPFGFHEVDDREQTAAVQRLLEPLNLSLQAAADAHGWTWVGRVAAGFTRGHGYCAPWPDYGYPGDFEDSPLLSRRRIDYTDGWYRPPGRHGAPVLQNDGAVSWYRTASQSAALQGPTPRFLTSGTLHPNELGHAEMARLVLSEIGAGY